MPTKSLYCGKLSTGIKLHGFTGWFKHLLFVKNLCIFLHEPLIWKQIFTALTLINYILHIIKSKRAKGAGIFVFVVQLIICLFAGVVGKLIICLLEME